MTLNRVQVSFLYELNNPNYRGGANRKDFRLMRVNTLSDKTDINSIYFFLLYFIILMRHTKFIKRK